MAEAAKLEDIDPEAVPAIYAEAVKDFQAAPEVRRLCGWGVGLYRRGSEALLGRGRGVRTCLDRRGQNLS